MELKQYRDVWLAQKVEEFIGFYNREFFCLDNFSSFGFLYSGKYYQTVEHAYQSIRFKGVSPETEEAIVCCHSAYDPRRSPKKNLSGCPRRSNNPPFPKVSFARKDVVESLPIAILP